MIRAMVFDLDGTLVQTERLKALSYARAAVELCPQTLAEADVIEAFGSLVGLSRQEVAEALIGRFGLEAAARAHMAEFGVTTPWQAFVQVRMRFYDALLADPEVLRRHQWPHNVALLQWARELGCKTALATMSGREEAQHVLDILSLDDAFNLVMTRDDVEHAKPDPEIYSSIARALGLPAAECLVIEDSLAGVQAAVAAGMHVIAVTTPLTRETLHRARILPAAHVVEDPDDLARAMAHIMAQHAP